MFDLNYFQLAELLNASIKNNIDVTCQKACIDSRQCKDNDLFVALKGAQVDGHYYVEQAYQNGAVAALVERPVTCDIPQLIVEDSVAALQTMAHQQSTLFQGKKIALTGSYGKTTVKEMIASMLSQQGRTLATTGNQNNTLGLPLTLLQLEREHDYAVLELGINMPGEMQQLVDITGTIDVALITGIADAHVQGLGGKAMIAKEKGLIYSILDQSGTAIINSDCEFYDDWINSYLADRNVLSFGLQSKAVVTARNITLSNQGYAYFDLITPQGKIAIQGALPGKHQVMNSLAAAAVANSLKLSLEQIKAGLESITGIPGRLMLKSGINSSLIIDDTYNASNFQAVNAAMELLAHYKGKKIFVFGGIAELGEKTAYYHHLIGETAKQLGIDYLYGCGQSTHLTVESYGNNGIQYKDKPTMLKELISTLDGDTIVLVKGSRITELDKTVIPFLTGGKEHAIAIE